MNRELKGFMAKHDITQLMLSKELHVSIRTISTKIKNKNFTQKEIENLITYFRKYDKQANLNIFFES